MKTKKLLLAIVVIAFAFTSCNKEDNIIINDVKLEVDFVSGVKSLKSVAEWGKYTPKKYYMGLKSATIIGDEESGTADVILFNRSSLASSEVYEFTETSEELQSILPENVNIPEGKYTSVKFELYYLQMKLDVKLDDGTMTERNIRIYFSDDAQAESGLHQPGDVTSISNDGVETGWLFGGHDENLSGVTPRSYAYDNGQETGWGTFATGSAQDWGPFGNNAFWDIQEQPIFIQSEVFNFEMPKEGGAIIVKFPVNEAWWCTDRNSDGYFNPSDIGEDWHMVFPQIEVYVE